MTRKHNTSQNLSFAKMQALGNDFVVIDGTKQKVDLQPKFIQQLGDRHFGIGFDQLLLIEPAKTPKVDFYYRIFNADGTEVSQCGNGARCIARFAKEQGLTSKRKITFETHRATIESHILKDNLVRVNMGIPEWNLDKIPFVAKSEKKTYTLLVTSLKRNFDISVLSFGNPHCVLWTDTLDEKDLPIQKVGHLLSKHPRFPEEANVSFTKILNRKTISLRIFERGVGETLACGSAACAAMVASKSLNLLDDQVDVIMKGGKLSVEWSGGNAPVWLTGPAEFVFNGIIAKDFHYTSQK